MLHEHARLLNASRHVHGDHSNGVLAVHHELLLLVVLALVRVVVSLVRARLSVDDSRFTIHLGVAHLWDPNLLDKTAVRVGWHRELLMSHVLLLVMGLVLVNLMTSMGWLATLVDGLAKFEHSVGIRAVVLVRAGLSSIEVFADHSLVIFKPLITLNATTLACTSLVSTRTTSTITTTSTAPSASALEVVVFFAIHTAHVASTARGVHAASATPATHAIALCEVVSTLRSTSIVLRLLLVADIWCGVTSTTTKAAISCIVRVTTTTTVVASSATTTAVSSTLDVALVRTSRSLVHLALSSDYSTACLHTHMVRNWLIQEQNLIIISEEEEEDVRLTSFISRSSVSPWAY